MHIFLTGEIQCGKSTVISRVLSCFPGLYPGGFRTIKADDIPGTKGSVYIVSASDENEAQNENNRVGIRGGEKPTAFPEVFDRRGTELLRGAERSSLIIMDEIGKMEARAPVFCARVRELLDGNTPILGVVRKNDATPLQEYIRGHASVRLIEITEANRDAAPAEIARLISIELNRRRDSAGAFIFRGSKDSREVLTLRNGSRGLSFPKGHIEPGETAMEAAVREVWEETGLEIRLIPCFRTETVSGRDGETRKIIYFSGSVTGGTLHPEGDGFAVPEWHVPQRVLSELRFDADREPFIKALDKLL